MSFGIYHEPNTYLTPDRSGLPLFKVAIPSFPLPEKIAAVDTETGELQERCLKHPDQAESFYRELVTRSGGQVPRGEQGYGRHALRYFWEMRSRCIRSDGTAYPIAE